MAESFMRTLKQEEVAEHSNRYLVDTESPIGTFPADV
jgi:hypothetical protein